jgi:hypothetical protein
MGKGEHLLTYYGCTREIPEDYTNVYMDMLGALPKIAPVHARPFLSNGLIMKKTGAIHVTHSFNTNTDQATCLRFTEFYNPESERLKHNPSHLMDLPIPYRDITSRKLYHNSYRDHCSPNPKTPRELMSLGDNAICPMSNTVKDARSDLESYRAVRGMLSAKITPESAEDDPLVAARNRLDNTVRLVEDRIRGKDPNQYLFDSLEYRIQPPIDDNTCLVEHRRGKLVNFVTKAIVNGKYDDRGYGAICRALDTIAPVSIPVPLLQLPLQQHGQAAAPPLQRSATHSTTAVLAVAVPQHESAHEVNVVAPVVSGASTTFVSQEQALVRNVRTLRAALTSDRPPPKTRHEPDHAPLSQGASPSQEEIRRRKVDEGIKKHADRINSAKKR